MLFVLTTQNCGSLIPVENVQAAGGHGRCG
jgi:hypothetical protein